MRNSINSKKQKVFLSITAFTVPAILMLVVYACNGMFPFGNKSILVGDLSNQYISYFSYYKEILKGERSFLYTFSKNLGGDMIGLTAYYLLSPLNLILLFFSTDKLHLAVEIITLMKIGICGGTFYYCLTQNEEKSSNWFGIVFSTAYALMAYNIMYQQNIIWLDGIMILPLVIAGIRNIVQGKSPLLYLISLVIAIVTNYYIGFMICIFSVLFFGYHLFFENKVKNKIAIIIKYGTASLLAGGLSMWLLLPVLKSLEGGKAAFDISKLTMETNFYWNDFFVKLLIGSNEQKQYVSGLPNVYCSIIGLIFLGIFFLNRSVSFKKKIGAAAVLGFLYLCFWRNGLNLVWHGFNPPSWFPYRYSFVFCFFILYLAWYGYQSLYKIKSSEMLKIALLLAGGLGFVIIWMSRKPFSFMTDEKYLLNLGVILIGVILVSVYACNREKKNSRVFAGMIVGICCIELCANAVWSIDDFGYSSVQEYETFVSSTLPEIENIKNSDEQFYRIEKTFHRRQCDPMLLNYNGLSHFSSTEKTVVKNFMGQLGFRNHGFWARYNRGSTYAVDSLLGVKYLLSKYNLDDSYQLIDNRNDTMIYQNPYALSIGFMADEQILTFNKDEKHKFVLQNQLFKGLVDEEYGDIFVSENIRDIKLYNLEPDEENKGTYRKKDINSDAYIEYKFIADTEYPVFGYLGTDWGTYKMKKVNIQVNEKELGSYFDIYQYDIFRLGRFRKGEEVTVKVTLEQESVNITDVWFYHQDMEVFDKYYEDLSQEQMEFTSYTDSRLSGKITNIQDKEYVLFTIPAEDGWNVLVDGEKAEIREAGIFMAVEVTKGNHTIELYYIPRGAKAGVLITLSSFMICLLWGFLKRKGRL